MPLPNGLLNMMFQAPPPKPRNALAELLGSGPAPDLAGQFRLAGGNLLNQQIGPSYVAPQVNPSLGGLLSAGLEMAPGSGDYLAIQDFNKANQVGDRTGATMAAASLIPGVGELAGAAKGLMGAKGALSMAGGLLGQTVFHGTPHDFDAFRLDKIGTGEGAQAYGHGLYFAESPDVAKAYVPRDHDIEAKLLAMYQKAERSGDYGSASVLEDALIHRTPTELRKAHPNASKLIDQIEAIQKSAKGKIYTVDIPDSAIEKMLDWDKPLSEQPAEIQKAMAKVLAKKNPNLAEYLRLAQSMPESEWRALRQRMGINPFDALGTGGTIYKSFGDDVMASKALREAGIPGIKYLDQGSRGSGNGTRNFVVFDETLPKIVKKE